MITLQIPDHLVPSVQTALGEQASFLARRALDLREKDVIATEVTDELVRLSEGLGHLQHEIRKQRKWGED